MLMWLSAMMTKPETPESSGLGASYTRDAGLSDSGHFQSIWVIGQELTDQLFVPHLARIPTESVNYQVHFISKRGLLRHNGTS